MSKCGKYRSLFSKYVHVNCMIVNDQIENYMLVLCFYKIGEQISLENGGNGQNISSLNKRLRYP